MSTQKDFEKFISSVAESTGLPALLPDADGLVRVRIEDRYNLNLHFISESSKILCFIEICSIPRDASAEIYRELLAAGLFGQETGGGNFALEVLTNTIIYQYLFDFDASVMDVETFTSALEKMLSLIDFWATRLAQVVNFPTQATKNLPHNESVIRA